MTTNSTTDQAADRLLKTEETPTTDHAAELRGAIAQTRLVFEGHSDAQDALEYLEQVLAAGTARAAVPAPACTPAPPRDNSALAQIKRELFTTADQLQQPADLTVQLMLLAELRGMRAETTERVCPTHLQVAHLSQIERR